ncbi:T-complex protein 1 subunit zeta-like protein [Dinothrombium tinctorium]|uniref:T-complex protein 1 subunit zeta-like protein n=1 Tax=Dinothrombium tinctorium TaxID=1965070 RepID=A0A3S3PCL6_9ACAR|nr:T-complex protein 1 subunit zeta-like protein [Dinothrombium tinctorium]RWS12786.1 T-complex protein 1 subunit zeta-like protein [Dinothrombium tinctorium]RWS16784.1 T-complex protein 1 subunit zeta-like protein [Dinothrombium tinctorium]
MAAIRVLNPKAEYARHSQALSINISGAKGLQDVLKTNLGPKGTMKMLVSGAGDIKITKDGNVLLHEMQIQHPTASLIAKASTAQNDETGDGTTSTVLLIGELLKQAEIYINEGLHPRVIADGFELAKQKSIEVLDQVKLNFENDFKNGLLNVAKTALRTKIHPKIADQLTDICVDAILAIREENKPLDLFMVEIVEMQHRSEEETTLIKGLVLDHGARHPDMKKHVENAYILTCNVSLEYEKTSVHSGFFYKSAEEREKLVAAERKFIENRVEKIIELKNKVCTDGQNFVVINQQGIDPNSLDLLSKAGIVALRRAKRRNMERITLACGGTAMNSLDQLTPECLGFAGVVYEQALGDEKYTFIEQLKNPRSVTILIKAANKHTLTQIKDAVYDGLRAIKNAIEDKSLVPGAGAFEISAYCALQKYKNEVKGKAQLGVQAFSDALLVIPKTLASNAGFDPQDVIVKLLHEHNTTGQNVGVDLKSGEPVIPADIGVFDNYKVKRQLLNSCSVIACNLLLVDEIMKAGLTSLKGDKTAQ